jgi:hypothetical protein
MPITLKASRRSRGEPRYLQVAHHFYGEAFGARREVALAEAMADWSELNEDEQSFAVAHLHYLGLLAQARTQKLLVQVRDLLDEAVEGLGDLTNDEVEAGNLEGLGDIDDQQDDLELSTDSDDPVVPEQNLNEQHDDAEPQVSVGDDSANGDPNGGEE